MIELREHKSFRNSLRQPGFFRADAGLALFVGDGAADVLAREVLKCQSDECHSLFLSDRITKNRPHFRGFRFSRIGKINLVVFSRIGQIADEAILLHESIHAG